jgi:glycosyltransferase involved in cell wall biosynthesis
LPDILFVIGSLGLGGAESQLVMLARGLSRRGTRCAVFVLEPWGPLGSGLTSAGIRIIDGGFDSSAPRAIRIVQLLRALLRLWWFAIRTRPGVIHGFLPVTNLFAALAGRCAGIPMIVTGRRALGTHQDRYPLFKPFDRLTNRLSHRVTVNSRAVGNDTIRRDGIDPHRLVLIPNGLDSSRFAVAADDRPAIRESLGLLPKDRIIVCVGNLIAYKGHADLIDAFGAVLKNRTSIRLLLAGEDRGIGALLRQRADALGIVGAIEFLGRRSDIERILAAGDLFVLPSHEEGFSNALLEAMASGLPVVATDVGGNREALEDGALGLLVPPGNPAALAAAIGRLLDDTTLGNSLGARARSRISQHYSPESMIDAHLALYNGRIVHGF